MFSRFKTGSNLKAHLDTHDTTSYPCSLCEKVLNSRRTLRKHMLVHEDVCRHVCSFCNKAFKRRQTLKVKKLFILSINNINNEFDSNY